LACLTWGCRCRDDQWVSHRDGLRTTCLTCWPEVRNTRCSARSGDIDAETPRAGMSEVTPRTVYGGVFFILRGEGAPTSGEIAPFYRGGALQTRSHTCRHRRLQLLFKVLCSTLFPQHYSYTPLSPPEKPVITERPARHVVLRRCEVRRVSHQDTAKRSH
jgi:hypothetical protein